MESKGVFTIVNKEKLTTKSAKILKKVKEEQGSTIVEKYSTVSRYSLDTAHLRSKCTKLNSNNFVVGNLKSKWVRYFK